MARMRRELSELSTLHARIMDAKRYLSGLSKEQRWKDERARELDSEMTRDSWDFKLNTLLEPFLHALRLHFSPPETP